MDKTCVMIWVMWVFLSTCFMVDDYKRFGAFDVKLLLVFLLLNLVVMLPFIYL